MRTIVLMTAGALALGACGKAGEARNAGAAATPAAASTAASTTAGPLPVRKSGLWEQTMTRDGAPTRMGKMSMCVDAATDAKASVFGQKLGEGMCQQKSVSRGLDGSYSFATTCDLGSGGSITSKGTASGDFSSGYHVHSESDVSGASFAPLNGHHVTDVIGVYKGACPAGMAAGDIVLANGMTINANKAAAAAAALGGKAP